jgi:hypothetical protein
MHGFAWRALSAVLGRSGRRCLTLTPDPCLVARGHTSSAAASGPYRRMANCRSVQLPDRATREGAYSLPAAAPINVRFLFLAPGCRLRLYGTARRPTQHHLFGSVWKETSQARAPHWRIPSGTMYLPMWSWCGACGSRDAAPL